MGIFLKSRIYITCCFILFGVFAALPASADTIVESVNHFSKDGYTRVTIALSNSTSYYHERLSSPERVYIDFSGSRLGKGIKRNVKLNDMILKGIRLSQFNAETVRIVLDLTAIEKYEVQELTGPDRVVIDVFSSVAAMPEAVETYKVVLDPGHGGKDPGAIGPGGIMEKNVVLDIALMLKELLLKDGRFEVIMTRSTDVFLSLDERTVIANKEQADLFVSIHANAHRNKRIRGLETYLLNWTNDAEAMRVAARENRITERRIHEERSEIGTILASLQLQNKRDESLKVAHVIQKSMISSIENKYARVQNNGVKQALFYVLIGAEMPSVLVETSYISNKEEAKRLASKRYKEFLASGMASGIKAYFAGEKSVEQVAVR